MSNIFKLTSRKVQAQYIVVYCIYSGIYLASPIIIMRFIDSVIYRDYQKMLTFALLYFISFIMTEIASYCFSMMVGKVQADNFVRFFSNLNLILQRMDLREQALDIDNLNQQIGQNYEIASPYFFVQPMEALFSTINIITIFIIMFFINSKIALVLLVFVPCSFLASTVFEKKIYSKAEENLQNTKNIKEYISDQFRLTKEERFLEKKQLGPIDPLLKLYKTVHYKNCKIKSIYLYFFTYCFLNLAILLVIILSGFLTYEEQISIGVMYAFQNYTSQLWTPGECLMSFSADYQQAKPAIEGLSRLLDIKMIDYSSEKIRRIDLENFSVLDSEGKQITKKMNFTFHMGNIYIVCGENGSGKTTLIEAIMGFNRRFSGEILINRKNILSDDIVYFSADAYMSAIYNEEMERLSSGQKKYEQIKLFLETDKSVYIFDEPTNFVDKDKHKEILAMISQLKKANKLVIIVSHDHSLLTEDNCALKVEHL